jgi:hypothetical protein
MILRAGPPRLLRWGLLALLLLFAATSVSSSKKSKRWTSSSGVLSPPGAPPRRRNVGAGASLPAGPGRSVALPLLVRSTGGGAVSDPRGGDDTLQDSDAGLVGLAAKTFHVVAVACGDKYVAEAVALIRSIYHTSTGRRSRGGRRAHVHLVHDEPTAAAATGLVKALEAAMEAGRISRRRLVVTAHAARLPAWALYPRGKEPKHGGAVVKWRCALERLNIPAEFPELRGRVLYADTDVVVRSDLTALFDSVRLLPSGSNSGSASSSSTDRLPPPQPWTAAVQETLMARSWCAVAACCFPPYPGLNSAVLESTEGQACSLQGLMIFRAWYRTGAHSFRQVQQPSGKHGGLPFLRQVGRELGRTACRPRRVAPQERGGREAEEEGRYSLLLLRSAPSRRRRRRRHRRRQQQQQQQQRRRRRRRRRCWHTPRLQLDAVQVARPRQHQRLLWSAPARDEGS